jgi:predicted TIM-barrel fold metal-dependent hydrolase
VTIDVHTWIGGYPFRDVPHPDPDVLVRVLEREGVQGAWVGHLPSAFWRDPSTGNDLLFKALERRTNVLRAVPCVRPDWPQWERSLRAVAEHGAPAIRAYPPQWGLAPQDPQLLDLAVACGELGLVLVLTTRFEDARQRHWMDSSGDLPGAAVRSIARASDRVHVVVCAAGRALVEEVHWGLTPPERARVWWDISWLWGPPEDDLAHLLRTCGAERFVYGSAWPLRLTQTPRANLALLPDDLAVAQLATADVIATRAQSARRA